MVPSSASCFDGIALACQIFRPRPLHVPQVIGVVDHAAAVRVLVVDFDSMKWFMVSSYDFNIFSAAICASCTQSPMPMPL